MNVGYKFLLFVLILTYLSTSHGGKSKFPKASTPKERTRNLRDSSSIGKLYFLFLAEDVVLNQPIWKEYFPSSTPDGEKLFEIFIHRSNPSMETTHPHFFGATVVPSLIASNCDNDKIVHLLNSAFVHSDSEKDKFITLSPDSIPVKSFFDLYLSVMNSNASSICVQPFDSWEPHSTEDSPSKYVASHSPWMILTKENARKVLHLSKVSVEMRKSYFHEYTNLAVYNPVIPRCLEHYFFYYAIYGEVDMSNGAVSPLHSGQIKSHLNVEQGHCIMYEYSSHYDKESIFVRDIDLENVHVRGAWITHPTLAFLDSLHGSSSFYFARQFNAEDPRSYVPHSHPAEESKVGLESGSGKSGHMSLLHAILHLHMLRSNHSITSSPMLAFLESQGVLSNWKPSSEATGDNHGLRVLMISIDNRRMKKDLHCDDYLTYSAALLEAYCHQHGYDFLQFRPDNEKLISQVESRYGYQVKGSLGDKYGISVFHAGLQQYRSSSWGKLPVLWFLCMQYGHLYDYFWFMDSDTAISPFHLTRSLSDALEEWSQLATSTGATSAAPTGSSSASQGVTRGVVDPRQSLFIFFNNFPWRDDLPCAGIMIFKSTMESQEIFRHWWDYDIPVKNNEDFMEQDALWYMLEAPPSYHFPMNFSVVSLMGENQFLSGWRGLSDLWTVHVPNYETFRVNYFKNMLRMISLYEDRRFSQKMDHILQDHHINMDIFPIVAAMESYSQLQRNLSHSSRRTEYPTVLRGRGDDAWHFPRNTHLRPPQPPRGRLYNGLPLAINRGKEIYWVLNDTRHPFDDMNSFDRNGFDTSMVLRFNPGSPESQIPVGPSVSDIQASIKTMRHLRW